MNPASSTWDRIKKALAVVLGVGIIVGGTAFAAYTLWPEDSETAKAGFCDSLADFSTTVQGYAGLSPVTATNDELDSAYDDIAGAWNEVVDQGNDWVNAYDNELTDAYWDLYYAVEDLPGDNTASENLADLEDELQAFPSAFTATHDGSGCADS